MILLHNEVQMETILKRFHNLEGNILKLHILLYWQQLNTFSWHYFKNILETGTTECDICVWNVN